MYKVLLIVPYPELEGVVKKVYKRRFENLGFQLVIKDIRAEDLENENNLYKYDVLIGRGHSANILKRIMPDKNVVKIPITGYDLMRAILECNEKYNSDGIGIFVTDKTIHDERSLREAFGKNIKIYVIPEVNNITKAIKEARNEGIDTVIGGYSAVSAAQSIGLNSITIKNGEEAIYTVLKETVGIVDTMRMEQKRNKTYQTILQESNEGIMYVNEDGIIEIINKKAIQLLETDSGNIRQRKAAVVFPYLKEYVEKSMASKKFILNQLIRVGKSVISFDFAPVLEGDNLMGTVVTFQSASKIQQKETEIRKKLNDKGLVARYNFSDIVHVSSVMENTIRRAKKFGTVDSNVLIVGETGTGKELMAQSIHNTSKRQHGPFVAVNCAALPENLLESELFGYVEGAFTGSKKGGKVGLFEQANNGTLFLDEISELPINFQGKLLRVLQERQVRRVGDDRVTDINVRFIVATNKNLSMEVKKGLFRQDLLYRLDILRLNIPPLRERKDDIYPIFISFLKVYNKQFGYDIGGCTEKAKKIIENYDFSGNIRELRNITERLSVLCDEDIISEKLVEEALYTHNVNISNDYRELKPANEENYTFDIKKASECEKILSALQDSRGNKSKAAELLGIDRTTLWRKMKTYNIR